MEEIKISVICLTYNHEKYIEDTIKGIMMQNVDFKYEVIFHDDASEDNTVQIIKKYESEHKEIIRTICQTENQFKRKKNVQFLCSIFDLCRGKYIALCEGDDFWIDTHKLQKQVDFLDRNSEYVLTAHNSVRLTCLDGTLKVMNPYSDTKSVTAEEIIMQYNGNIATASIVIRKETLTEIEEMFWEYDVGDWPLQLASITKGKIYYFDRIMSVYRFAHKGSWTAEWEKDFDKTFAHCVGMIEFLIRYEGYTNHIYDIYIITRIQRYVASVLDMFIFKDKTLFYEKYEQLSRRKEKRYHVVIKELRRVFEQTFDENYYDKKLEKFVKGNERILIFGAGDYAGKLARQLINSKVYFDGFVVSDMKDKRNEYWGKPVWSINDFPFAKDKVGIIIGIKPIIWNELVGVLMENRIDRYICPFMFEVNKN